MKKHAHHEMYEKHAKGGHINHLGSDHWEKKYQDSEVADLKYASEFGAPEELKKQVDGLAGYVRKHKMSY